MFGFGAVAAMNLAVSFSELGGTLYYVLIAAVALSVLQWALCRKRAERGIPLFIITGSVSVAVFLTQLFGTVSICLENSITDVATWGQALLVALLVLLIYNIPTLALFLIYSNAKKNQEKKQYQEYMDRKERL